MSLASLHGKVVLLTFLDPVCTSDCPLIAQEFRAADRLLHGRSRQVELVAIVANPVYRTLAYTRAFDRQEGLAGVRELAVPDRPARAAATGVEELRGRGRDPAGWRDDRAQ